MKCLSYALSPNSPNTYIVRTELAQRILYFGFSLGLKCLLIFFLLSQFDELPLNEVWCFHRIRTQSFSIFDGYHLATFLCRISSINEQNMPSNIRYKFIRNNIRIYDHSCEVPTCLAYSFSPLHELSLHSKR